MAIVVGSLVAPKRYAHVPEPMNMPYLGKIVFADRCKVKDFEMSLSWVV